MIWAPFFPLGVEGNGEVTKLQMDTYTPQHTQKQGGRTHLPKFKFSAKFPIGLQQILKIQIKKIKNALNHMCKIILTTYLLECNLALFLK